MHIRLLTPKFWVLPYIAVEISIPDTNVLVSI